MIKNKAIWIGLALSLVGLVSASSARADDLDKKTVLTFSQPVEIPGVVLPAGTYTFKLANAFDRHIVQIPVHAAIQTTPIANGSSSVAGTTGVTETGRSARANTRRLPKTASTLPLIALFGVVSIGAAFGLMAYGKRATGSAA